MRKSILLALALAGVVTLVAERNSLELLPTAMEPYFVAAGDLNGDGHADLVLPCRGELLSPRLKRPANDTITIYLTQGVDEPVRRRDVQVGFGPYTAAVTDLDGDGLSDVVVANFQSNDGRDVSILYGSPDRERLLEPAVSLKVEPASLPYLNLRNSEGEPVYPTPGITSIAIADLNHDGIPDIAAVGWSVDKLFVFFNQGHRRFRQTSYPLPPGPRDLAIGDFNGDGNPDIAMTLYSSNQVTVWTGDHNGKFRPWQTFFSQGSTPYHLKAADVDRDGRLDLVVGNRGPSDNVAVFRNKGDRFEFIGSYQPGTPKKGETTADEIRDVLVTDWNGDGIPDLIAACHVSSKLVLWEGTGQAGFGRTFDRRHVLEFPGKGPRSVIPFGGGLAVAFFDSNELGIIDPRAEANTSRK
jgi:hypothetical protein